MGEKRRKNSEAQFGDIGEPMETLVFDFLFSKLSRDFNVSRWPGTFPSAVAITNPDILIGNGEKLLYIDVSVTDLGYNIIPWGRKDHKSKQRQIFAKPRDPVNVAGLVIYQQNIMLPEGFYTLADIARQAMTSGITSRSGQQQIDLACDTYQYSIMKGDLAYWRETADNLREALTLS